MKLQRIEIQNVRNLRNISLLPSKTINILYGDNASGKTSFLEALHLLSYGKSFRTRHISKILFYGASQLLINGRLVNEDKQAIPIGIAYKDKRFKIKVAGQTLHKTSELAQYFPLTIIHQESHRILTDGPKFRKQFLDRGVFHVEHRFLSTWYRYARALKQRNSALQNRSGMESVWNHELRDTALHLHALRQRYLDDFIPVFKEHVEKLLMLKGDLEIRYLPGWRTEMDYFEMLDAGCDKDRVVGYTRKGPHRVDLDLRYNSVPVHECLSRGQQKLLVSAMLITQAEVYRKRMGSSGFILIDDMDAELDRHHIGDFIQLIDEMNAQAFVTTTDKALFDEHRLIEKKMFHVEQGRIKEVL